MFDKIIINPKVMRVVTWFLSHPEEEYTPLMIANATGLLFDDDIVHAFIILEEAEFLNIKGEDATDENVLISLNNGALIVDHFKAIRNILDLKLLCSEKATWATIQLMESMVADMEKKEVDISDLEKDLESLLNDENI